jgi:hypothetical protein
VVELRWVLRLLPLALGGVVVVAFAAASSAGSRSPVVAACEASTPSAGSLAGEAWFRLDPVLDERGILIGQRLAAGRPNEPANVTLDLAPESFAAGPYGRVVLYGSDDGRRSEVWALDVSRECTDTLGHTPDVVRSATLATSGDTVFEHRVDRATRADLGVFRRSVATGTAVRVLSPFPIDERAGPTFATLLSWSTDDRLAIQACGVLECRLRILDPGRPGESATTERLGVLIGVVGDQAVAYEPCLGLPCPIVAVDIRTGSRVELAENAGTATLAEADGAAVLVHERPGTGTLAVVGLDGRQAAAVTMPAGTRLATGSGGSGGRAPAGSVLVAPLSTSGQPVVERATPLRIHPAGSSSEVTR